MAIFSEGILGSIEIVGQGANDLLYVITQPFIDNKDLIKETVEGMLEPISSILTTIKQGIQDTFSKFWDVYNTYISPAVENIKNGFSSILQTVLTVWNENIKPILDEWGAKFDILWQEHIQPMVDSFLEFVGKIVNGISEIWNTWLAPLINWIVETIVPILVPIFESIGNTIGAVFSGIIDTLQGFWNFLSGIIDFIVGVFTGDWDKAWQAIQNMTDSIWQMIKGTIDSIWQAIIGVIDTAVKTVEGAIDSSLAWIKKVWDEAWNSISNFVSSIWNGITRTIDDVINGIKNTISDALNTINTIWNNIWEGMKNTVTNIFNGIWNVIKSVINSILGGIESMTNGVISGINGIIRLLNNLRFTIPDWVPVFGGKSFGFNIPQMNRISLPRLAEGGYVKANTPQLAMIGDNRHQGEIVAPEDKLEEIYRKVLKEQGIGNNDKVTELLKIIIELLKNIDFTPELIIDGYRLNKVLEKIKNKKKFATNGG